MAKEPISPERARAREVWLQRIGTNLDARIEWLEARLEHARAIRSVIKESQKRSEPAPSAHKQGGKKG
jgi:hypothetical protein